MTQLNVKNEINELRQKINAHMAHLPADQKEGELQRLAIVRRLLRTACGIANIADESTCAAHQLQSASSDLETTMRMINELAEKMAE